MGTFHGMQKTCKLNVKLTDIYLKYLRAKCNILNYSEQRQWEVHPALKL